MKLREIVAKLREGNVDPYAVTDNLNGEELRRLCIELLFAINPEAAASAADELELSWTYDGKWFDEEG